MEVVASQDHLARKIYSITAAGTEALQAWLELPPESDSTVKKFVMRLALAAQFSQAGLRGHLEQRRERVAAQKVTLERSIDAKDVDLGERLMLDYGLSMAVAELAWLDNTLVRLSELSLAAEAAES
jgi:hypothetical protein